MLGIAGRTVPPCSILDLYGRTDSQGDNVSGRNTDSRFCEIPRKEVRESRAG